MVSSNLCKPEHPADVFTLLHPEIWNDQQRISTALSKVTVIGHAPFRADQISDNTAKISR